MDNGLKAFGQKAIDRERFKVCALVRCATGETSET